MQAKELLQALEAMIKYTPMPQETRTSHEAFIRGLSLADYQIFRVRALCARALAVREKARKALVQLEMHHGQGEKTLVAVGLGALQQEMAVLPVITQADKDEFNGYQDAKYLQTMLTWYMRVRNDVKTMVQQKIEEWESKVAIRGEPIPHEVNQWQHLRL